MKTLDERGICVGERVGWIGIGCRLDDNSVIPNLWIEICVGIAELTGSQIVHPLKAFQHVGQPRPSIPIYQMH